MASTEDFNQFRKKALIFSRQLSPRPATAAGIAGQMTEKLARAKAVSFDVFDTLTTRSVYHPEDVFKFLADQPAFQALGLPASVAIAKERHKAEHATYASLHREKGNGNATLLEIYQTFCADLGLDPKKAPSLVAAEEEVELLLGLANDEAHFLFEEAVASAKSIVIISDTYHSQEFLARLLKSCGYAIEGKTIYSSCHHRASKGEGKLFEIVLKDRKLQPGELLHIGDNGQSDHQVPAKLGIETLWHPFRAYEPGSAPDYHEDAAPLHAQVRSLSERIRMPRRTPHDFWFQLGYRVTGPLLSGYAFWLRDHFERSKISRAYFLLRDGALIHRVYQILVGDDSPCATRTLPSSRRAMVIPVLDLDAELVLPQLFVTSRRDLRPVGDFLRRLRVDPLPFEKEIAAVGLVSSTHAIDGHAEQRKLMQLFRQPRVTQAVVAQARTERELLFQYLTQEGVAAPGRAAVVDIGWHGSIQKALAALWRSKNLAEPLVGYYLGTSAGFHEGAADQAPGLGYLFHLGRPRGLTKVLTEGREVVETLCSSPEGSLLYFEENNGRAVPVFDQREADPEKIRTLQGLHEGAAAFAGDFRQRRARHGWTGLPVEVALENLVRLITRPTSEEAKLLGAFVHGENLGTQRGRALAAFRPESTEPEELFTDYQNAYWKQGLLFQRNEQSARLRTLLWLLEDNVPNLSHPVDSFSPPYLR
jgi:FMN phosphatase YigB (HAD superfamily)